MVECGYPFRHGFLVEAEGGFSLAGLEHQVSRHVAQRTQPHQAVDAPSNHRVQCLRGLGPLVVAQRQACDAAALQQLEFPAGGTSQGVRTSR